MQYEITRLISENLVSIKNRFFVMQHIDDAGPNKLFACILRILVGTYFSSGLIAAYTLSIRRRLYK
jgi:hypothetical protein